MGLTLRALVAGFGELGGDGRQDEEAVAGRRFGVDARGGDL